MANAFLRLLKHRLYDEADALKALGPHGVARLERHVAESERRHSGEIRVCVESGLPWSYLWRGADARERAIAMFGKLRVWDTEHNNGVLIYLLLAEHRIEIVADRGLAKKVDVATWRGIADSMREAFRTGRFAEGLDQALTAVDALLVQHFPLGEGDANPNELPNRPYVR
jgi:uncharacterized membrane protein YgcG